MGRDIIINQALIKHHMDFGVALYNIVSVNPLEIALGFLCVKLGLSNKILISLILAFLI